MEQVKLYDTTLRDGMQGEGMSLSASEKARVVLALDALGVQMIEAGFPSSNPKEVELFEQLAELELEQATICAFGMTRRRDTARRGRSGAADPGRQLRAGRHPGRQDLGLHLEKVTKVSREENLAMIADSVAFCRDAGQARVYDAEHFFDGYRDDPGYALECLEAAVGAGAENVSLCDTNGSSLPEQVADGDRGRGRAAGRGGRDRHPRPRRRRLRRRQLAGRGARGRPPGPGHASTATASAAATPT